MCVRGTEWAELACKSKNGLQHAIVLIILFIAYIYIYFFVCVLYGYTLLVTSLRIQYGSIGMRV